MIRSSINCHWPYDWGWFINSVKKSTSFG